MYRHGSTAHATPPSNTWPTANIEDEVALVITRYLGPTNSAAEIIFLVKIVLQVFVNKYGQYLFRLKYFPSFLFYLLH